MFSQILVQHEVYQNVCNQFKQFLGEEDFLALNTAPFWNEPNVEEFRSNFINSPRPIIRALAQERLKLWTLLTSYWKAVSSCDGTLQGILTGNDPSSTTVESFPLQTSALTCRGLKEYVISFSKVVYQQSYAQYFYHSVSGMQIDVSVQHHIVEDDEGIRNAKIAAFNFQRKSEFVDLLKTLQNVPDESLKLFLYTPPPPPGTENPWGSDTISRLASFNDTTLDRSHVILLNAYQSHGVGSYNGTY
ncbi:hypothetical protein EON65_55540, partial [archaeon]